MKKTYIVDDLEKNRILEMHLNATKKNYLLEQQQTNIPDLSTYRTACSKSYKNSKLFQFVSDPLLGKITADIARKKATITGVIVQDIDFKFQCSDAAGSVCPKVIIKDSNTNALYTFQMMGKKKGFFKLLETSDKNFRQANQTARDWKSESLYNYLLNNLFAGPNAVKYNQTFANVKNPNDIYNKWCPVPNV
jgi:hypothetical protein